MNKLAVLMASHNRRKSTMACLDSVFASTLPPDVSLTVFLVDDASSDGTGAEVRARYPQVVIEQGTGDLFWNRAMRLAWDTAARTDPDFYVWLNDDVTLHPDGLAIMVRSSRDKSDKAIICGTMAAGADEATSAGAATYGGYAGDEQVLEPNGSLQACTWFNGNCLLVPRSVYKRVGNLNPFFRHSFGDFDYGVRARNLGVESFVAPDYCGTCSTHTDVPRWRRKEVPLLERTKALYGPLGCNPVEHFVFDRPRAGLAVAIFHFVGIHLRMLFPWVWDLRRKG